MRQNLWISVICAGALILPIPALAQAQQAAPAVARSDTRTLDSWTLNCGYGKDDKLISCVGSLRVSDKEKSRTLAVWYLRKGDGGKLTAGFEVPTGVRIASGVEISVDKTSKVLPFANCGTQSCSASGVLEDDLLKRLSGASVVSLKWVGLNGRDVKIDFPPTGLDKVATALRK